MIKIKQLVVVGGPSAAGKSTLLNELRQGFHQGLSEQLSMINPGSYLYLKARELGDVQVNTADKLLVHYDFVHQYSPKKGFPWLAQLIRQSQSVTVLTLCVPENTLLQRISDRLAKAQELNSWHSGLRRKAVSILGNNRYSDTHSIKINTLKIKQELYQDTAQLINLFRKWSEFLESCGVTNHMLLETWGTTGLARPYTEDEINNILQGALAKPG